MPIPTQPSLSLTRLSPTSFRATVSGADGGMTNTLYVRRLPNAGDQVAGSIVGNGTIDAVGLAANAGYLAWVVSDDGTSQSLPAIGAVSLASTDTVSGAICAKARADAALMSLCPEIWANEIPEVDAAGKPLLPPILLVEVPEEVPDWHFEADTQGMTWSSRAVVTCYAKSQAQADQIAAAFGVVFDWQPLPFATARTLNMGLERTAIGRDEVVDAQGHRVFYRILEYQVLVGR